MSDDKLFIHSPADWGIHFHNDVGDDVGKLSFDSQGQLEFTGEADKAARIFFDNVIEHNSEKIRELEERIEELESDNSRLASEVACYR